MSYGPNKRGSLVASLENRLDQYAELLVRVGLNLQPAQTLVIGGTAPVSLEHADLVRRITAKAYEAGAGRVQVFWQDEAISRMTLERASAEALGQYPAHLAAWLQELAEGGAAFLTIAGSDPNLLTGVDPGRIGIATQAAARGLSGVRPFMNRMQVSWGVAAAASQGWADIAFAHLPAGERVGALWEAILSACRVTGQNDPVADWQAHMERLGKKQTYLNTQSFAALHFRGPGTDLYMDLPAGHRWISVSGTTNARGLSFAPNIPSEEIFTAPRLDGVTGTVRATLPLNYKGALIYGLTLRFEGGRVVEYSADSGREILSGLFETDDGARRLGEVALVPVDSPIAQTGTLFYNTLFDENASCHLAVGQAYPACVEGGTGLSREGLMAAGLNQSMTHVDFMIGSAELEIDGVTGAGERVALFRRGNWA